MRPRLSDFDVLSPDEREAIWAFLHRAEPPDLSTLIIAEGQRDEFKRRATQSRRALEDARNAYDRSDMLEVGRILLLYTAHRSTNTNRKMDS